MAKHLGTRRRPRLRHRSRGTLPRRAMPHGVAWGLRGLLTMVVLTVGTLLTAVVAQGIAGHGGTAVMDTTAGHQGRLGHPGGSRHQAHAGHQTSRHQTPGGIRRVDISRQAARPHVSPYRVQRGATLSLKPAVVLARKIDALSPAHSTFTIAQSNVLGSQHTAGRGGYGPGPYRAGITASLLTSRGVDLGGMQEVQSNQLSVFRNRMPAYSFWPGTSLGHNGERLQVYWRTDRFTMEKSGSVTYTFASQHIPLPYVLLRDNDSGAEFWVITTHNSAGGMEAQRDSATGVEINLINQLRAGGLPVIITGDMNEHTEFFCRVAASTGMVAANGGSGAGGCHLPPPPLRVDWIMGSGVSFSGYRQDAAGLHRASDHYYLYAEATATSDWFAPGTTP